MSNFAETLEQLRNPRCSLCGKKSIWSLLSDGVCLACLIDLNEKEYYEEEL